MAFDDAPSVWISGMKQLSSDGAGAISGAAASTDYLLIPIGTDGASLAGAEEISTAEADPTTGDIRKVFYGLMKMMFDAWDDQESADRPSQMTLSKSSGINSSDQQERTYYGKFTLDGTLDVADES